MSFGGTIKRLRKEKKMTQDQLANLLNVTPQAISRWENNSAMPDISQLVPIANVFKVSTDTLLEVNVEETEKQISETIDRTLLSYKEEGRSFLDDQSVVELREAVRRFPQDVRLKRILVGALEGRMIQQQPFPDPAVIREITGLMEDCIEYGEDPEQIASDKAALPKFYAMLGQTERVREMAEEAPEMDNCREVIVQNALKGREQVDARKNLIFNCTDQMIRAIQNLCEENAEDLTESEWQELNRARNVIDTVYGEGFSDYYMLIDLKYGRVHGAVARNNIEEALDILEEIVRGLQRAVMEEQVPETSLILDAKYKTLWLMSYTAYTISNNAHNVLKRMARDFDLERMKSENQRFGKIVRDMEELADSDDGRFMEYCEEKFLESVMIGAKAE